MGVPGFCWPSPGAPLLGVWADWRRRGEKGGSFYSWVEFLLESSRHVFGTDARGQSALAHVPFLGDLLPPGP